VDDLEEAAGGRAALVELAGGVQVAGAVAGGRGTAGAPSGQSTAFWQPGRGRGGAAGK
jgi:hypothetical protein